MWIVQNNFNLKNLNYFQFSVTMAGLREMDVNLFLSLNQKGMESEREDQTQEKNLLAC